METPSSCASGLNPFLSGSSGRMENGDDDKRPGETAINHRRARFRTINATWRRAPRSYVFRIFHGGEFFRELFFRLPPFRKIRTPTFRSRGAGKLFDTLKNRAKLPRLWLPTPCRRIARYGRRRYGRRRIRAVYVAFIWSVVDA